MIMPTTENGLDIQLRKDNIWAKYEASTESILENIHHVIIRLNHIKL